MPTETAQTELTLACHVYRFLHHVPPEYFTRPVRAELVKRAMAGDVQICAVLVGADGRRSDAKGRVTVRGDKKLRGKPDTEESDDRALAEGLKSWPRRLTFVRAFLQRMGPFLNVASHTVSFMFLFSTVLMQDMYEDFLGFCHPSAQPIMHIFLYKGTHECHPRFDTITRCVRSAHLSLCMLTMISPLGASYAHKNQKQQHPSPASYLRL